MNRRKRQKDFLHDFAAVVERKQAEVERATIPGWVPPPVLPIFSMPAPAPPPVSPQDLEPTTNKIAYWTGRLMRAAMCGDSQQLIDVAVASFIKGMKG